MDCVPGGRCGIHGRLELCQIHLKKARVMGNDEANEHHRRPQAKWPTGEGRRRLSFCPVTGMLAWRLAPFGDRIMPTSPWTFSGHTAFIKSNSWDRLHLLLSFGTSVSSM